MRSPVYKQAIERIALNDDVDQFDYETISQQLTVVLIADIYGISPEKVTTDVIHYRTWDIHD